MADIQKKNVRAYVRELIAKEFGTNANAEKGPSDKRDTLSDESRDEKPGPFYNQPLMGK